MSESNRTAFHLLLIGDFSGRANRRLTAPPGTFAGQRPQLIDCDNFDEVFAGMEISLERIVLANRDDPISIRFRELDDLHPDQIFSQVELFATFRSLRRRLLNPATFAEAAQEVYSWNPPTSSNPAEAPVPVANTDVSSLLETMLEQATSIDAPRPEIDFQQLIRQIVAPYMPQQLDPRQDELVACVDSATETLMTALLHHPHFQQLESTWRGLEFVIRRVEFDTDLKIYLLDMAPDELASDLLDADGMPRDISATRLYRMLVEQTVQTPGGIPWSLIGWLKPIVPVESDLRLLEQLSRLCEQGRSRLVVSAAGQFIGCHLPSQTPDPDQWLPPSSPWKAQWDTFRAGKSGSGVAMLWPRFLLRLPYGAKQLPVEAFAFEEWKVEKDHDLLLWGNPLFLLVASVCQAYSRDGWELDWSRGVDIPELPWFVTRTNGDPTAQPCGELLLSERGASRLRAMGITPVLSFPNRNSVRLPGLESIGGTEWGWPE